MFLVSPFRKGMGGSRDRRQTKLSRRLRDTGAQAFQFGGSFLDCPAGIGADFDL